MAPAIPYDPATTQDAVDAKLNQTVFVIAFGGGGVVLSLAVMYICFLLIRKYRKTKSLENTEGKYLPKQLLLPARAGIAASFPKRLILSPVAASRVDGTQPLFEEKKTINSPWAQTSTQMSQANGPAPITYASYPEPIIVQIATRTEEETFTLGISDSSSFEVDLGTPDSETSTLSSVSTIVEVIEPVGAAPKIVVEDFAPLAARSHLVIISDSDSDSVMPVDDEKIDSQFLAVPPMSWNAPKDPVADQAQATQVVSTPTETSKKSKSMSSMLSILGDISNVVRLRPRLPTSSSTSPTKVRKLSPTSPTRSLGRLKENAFLRAP